MSHIFAYISFLLKKHAVKHFRNGFLEDFYAENFCIEKFIHRVNVSPKKKKKIQEICLLIFVFM